MNKVAFAKGYMDTAALAGIRKAAAGAPMPPLPPDLEDMAGHNIPEPPPGQPVGADGIEPPPPPTGNEGKPGFQGAAVVDNERVTEIPRASGPEGDPQAPAAVKHEVEYKDGSTMKVESKGPQPEEPQQPQQPPPPPAVDLPSLGSPELTGQGAPEPGKAGPDMNQVPSLR